MRNAKHPSRRMFLRQAAGAAIGMTLVPLTGCEDNLVEPLVEGTDIPFLTDNDSFFVQFGANGSVPDWPGVPTIAQTSWSVAIDGLVANPLAVTFQDLIDEQSQSLTVLKTIRCIIDGNFIPGLIGNAVWTGVPLRIFLDRAGIDLGRTRRLRIHATDGFTNNLTIDQIYGDRPADTFEPLLVYQMNGQPLTPDHGFPVRLLVNEHYGYKNVKWVERIEATDDDTVFGSYQQQLGYIDDGVIRVTNKVTNPLTNQTVAAGPFKVFGYALSGYAGIERVEVSIDDSPFQEARIVPLTEVLGANPALRTSLQVQDPQRFTYPYRGVWALWEFDWNASPGNHTFLVRAIDWAGNVQPAEDFEYRDGSNPYFRVDVTV